MKRKTSILTALLTVLGTIVLAQPGIILSPGNLPDGKYGSLYSNETFTVTGGNPPYSFSVSKGKLPPGMNLSDSGVLSGTPTLVGNYSFTITAQGNIPGPPGGGPGGAGPPGQNQNSVSQNFNLTVDPAPLSIAANNATMNYGGAVPALTVSYTGFVDGDNASSLSKAPTAKTTATSASPPGNYPITVSGAKDDNYTITYVSGTMTVGHATLTITANPASMTYGGGVPALTVSYSGFIRGDNASSLTTPPSITTTATSTSRAGTYPISVSGAADPTYTIVYSPGTLTVDPATVHVTAKTASKQYGAPDPALTYSVSGFLNGDDASVISGSLSRAQGETVGVYSITIGSLNAGSDYTISYTGSTFTITQASQQIKWTQSLSVGCVSTTQVQLNAASSSGLPVTYSVSNPNVAAVSGNVLTLLQPGTAVVTAAQEGNADYTAAAAVADTVSYQSTSLISEHWNDVLFFDNSSGDYIAWQWYKNGAAVPGDTTADYTETPALNGQYYVVAMNKDGQQIQSCTLTITPGAAVPGGIRVFPNPAKRGAEVTVTSNYSAGVLQGARLQIADMTGKIIKVVTNVQPSMSVSMPSADGIYIVNLLLTNGQKISTNVLVGE
jgi:MBG domain-containing protein